MSVRDLQKAIAELEQAVKTEEQESKQLKSEPHKHRHIIEQFADATPDGGRVIPQNPEAFHHAVLDEVVDEVGSVAHIPILRYILN